MPLINNLYDVRFYFNEDKEKGDQSILVGEREGVYYVIKVAKKGTDHEENLEREDHNINLLSQPDYIAQHIKFVKAYPNMPPLVHHTLNCEDIMFQYSYLVFEYNGNSRSLLNFLKYLRDNGIRLSEAAQKFLVLQLLGLFKFLAQKGYCHGDFKPDNILIVLTPKQGIRLMFIDMSTMHPKTTFDNKPMGTNEYMAPERLL